MFHSTMARRADLLLSRLAENEIALRKAYGLVTEAVHRGRRITPAAEWFIDNFHLIEEQVHTARRHFPRGYSRELPRLADGPNAGMPRVYDIAIELISHSHGRVDATSLRAFVAAYQAVRPLRLGELWVIPIMLRLALLEDLRRIVANVTAGRSDRERAGHWVDRMLETAGRCATHCALRDDAPLPRCDARLSACVGVPPTAARSRASVRRCGAGCYGRRGRCAAGQMRDVRMRDGLDARRVRCATG